MNPSIALKLSFFTLSIEKYDLILEKPMRTIVGA